MSNSFYIRLNIWFVSVFVLCAHLWKSYRVIIKHWFRRSKKNSMEMYVMFFFSFLWDRVSLLSSKLECNGMISAHYNPCLLGSSDSLASALRPPVAGITGVCCHTQLIFVFLVETGFHHVGQYGLDLLTSWSAGLGLPKSWDCRCEPPHPACKSYVWQRTYN